MKQSIKISDYEQQAIDFLKSTETTLEINYSHTDKYFSNDTEKRDIYRFTFKNSKGVFSALFGDSINNTSFRAYVSGKNPLNYKQDFDFCKSNGLRVVHNRVIPTFLQRERKPGYYDILACMDSYMPDTFEDFCTEYGYDDLPLSEHDNIMRIFLNVREQVAGMKKLFTPDQLEQLSEIQ